MQGAAGSAIGEGWRALGEGMTAPQPQIIDMRRRSSKALRQTNRTMEPIRYRLRPGSNSTTPQAEFRQDQERSRGLLDRTSQVVTFLQATDADGLYATA